jgi:hypothetical protein
MNKDDIVFRDKFGNKVSIAQLNDGTFRKTTQTNKNTEFEFLGNTYSYSLLISSRKIKEYWETSRSERYLVEDKYGQLFHYRFDEEMNFDGGDDRQDILWTFVTDEKDSDQLAEVWMLSLLREPYVAADETDWMAAHEYVDQHFVNKLGINKKLSIKRLIDIFKSLISL